MGSIIKKFVESKEEYYVGVILVEEKNSFKFKEYLKEIAFKICKETGVYRKNGNINHYLCKYLYVSKKSLKSLNTFVIEEKVKKEYLKDKVKKLKKDNFIS